MGLSGESVVHREERELGLVPGHGFPARPGVQVPPGWGSWLSLRFESQPVSPCLTESQGQAKTSGAAVAP